MIERKLTTREAGERLGLRYDAALTLLKAAGSRHVRAGSAYLWDLNAVERLADAIGGDAVGEREAVHV